MFSYLSELFGGGRQTIEKKFNLIFKPDEPQVYPVDPLRKITNFAKNNFRGIIGVLVPLIILPIEFERYLRTSKTEVLLIWMFWFFLFQPVDIPVTGMIPIFYLPMSGTMSTVSTCQCYMNENIVLFLLSGMLLLLLSNAGVDRRLALWFLCSGHPCQFSAKRLIFKVCMAAFFMSMFCNRLLVTSMLTQYVTAAMTHMQTFSKGEDVDYDEMRYILNTAIQTSAGIGSITIMHCSQTSLLFRAIWHESPNKYEEYPDIFNYLQYSSFAYPVALSAILLNYLYFTFIAGCMLKDEMELTNLVELQKTFRKYKSDVPLHYTSHEKLATFFTLVYLSMFFFRFSFLTQGWADFSMDHHSTEIVRIKDATCAAIFVILLHVLPKGYGFLTFIDAAKRSELPPIRPESAILWWKYVDMNTNYGYIFLFGGGIALQHAIRESGLEKYISEYSGTFITDRSWNTGMFMVCFIAAALSNMMPAAAACAIFCPISVDARLPWPVKSYVAALGVGIATAFGFCFPFKYSPAYFCYHTGKVPMKKMFCYSFISVWICVIVLWIFLIYYAGSLFDADDQGILRVSAPLDGGGTTPTTPAPNA